MTISKKVLSALIASSLVVPSVATNLVSANAVEPETTPLNALKEDSKEKLAKDILENGTISSVVVTENNTSEVPLGFEPISDFSYNGEDLIMPFGADPGGAGAYWDGFYVIDSTAPTWAIAAGIAYAITHLAKKYKLPDKVTNALISGTAGLAATKITIKGTQYYKLLSLTSAEYYANVQLYINGKLINSTSHTWTATVDTNTD